MFRRLLSIVLASLAFGHPSILQDAREQVAPEVGIIRRLSDYVITAAGGLAFAVMVIAELGLLYVPGLQRCVGIIAVVLHP